MTKSVLVVDDNVFLADMTTRALCELGFDAVFATNARRALRMASDCSFDGAVIDVDLKGRVDGVQLLRAMRDADPDLSAVLVTGYELDSLDLPEDICVLRKPFRIGELVSAVFREPTAS